MEKKAFELSGKPKVEACLIARDPDSIMSTEVEKIEVYVGSGVFGDRHAKPRRLVDAREPEFVKSWLGKGGEIANLRQFSAVSIEEMASVAKAMGIPGIPRGCLGENLIVSGIPKFTQLPFGTRLLFEKPDGEKRKAMLLVCEENMPCRVAGEAIQKKLQVDGLASSFPKAAIGKRGVVGIVSASGKIHVGDKVTVIVPRQRIYDPN